MVIGIESKKTLFEFIFEIKRFSGIFFIFERFSVNETNLFGDSKIGWIVFVDVVKFLSTFGFNFVLVNFNHGKNNNIIKE
jgi:hypothetical protein